MFLYFSGGQKLFDNNGDKYIPRKKLMLQHFALGEKQNGN
jgi:hypothetical protein